jgi:hypothetical protein
MMVQDTIRTHRRLVLADWVGKTAFVFFLISTAAILYFDDIQLTRTTAQEVSTIYNTRFLGIKGVDAIAIALALLSMLYVLLKNEIVMTKFHTMLGIILLVYLYAGCIGFVYSFFLNYDYSVWVQDFQQTVYMVGFFLITFALLDTEQKWKTYAVVFLSVLAAKNVVILYRTVTGVGKFLGDWAFRASQNSEFTYFPMMFFPLVLLLLKTKSVTLRIGIAVVLLIYSFNALLGIVRTVWVMLIIGLVFLLFQLDRPSRYRLIGAGSLALVGVLSIIEIFFPRFLALAWEYKFASIFDWSISGDRSNATRTLEILNVTDYVFRHFAFIQGMGLGAWWDDSARRLLPDFGSGHMFKTRFHLTHMWYLTQLLKIGLVGMTFYWYAVYRVFTEGLRYVKTMPWGRWEKSTLLGLNIGLLCAFVSSADFVRLFLVIGINIGMTASFIHLNPPLQHEQE